MKNKLSELENILNYKFKNINLLKKSLVHKSYDGIDNNEKLVHFFKNYGLEPFNKKFNLVYLRKSLKNKKKISKIIY